MNKALVASKKSRFQKAREEAEQKKRLDEEEAAKVYDSFVASFQEEESVDSSAKVFLKNGKEDGVYNMSYSQNVDRNKAPHVVDTFLQTSGKGPKKEIDNFFNEIKNRIDRDIDDDTIATNSKNYREKSSNTTTALGMEKGSFDNGDPNTTNLYLGNLSPMTTEEHLLKLFSRYGEINSVKIMWPRNEEEKQKKKNCGFVSYKIRADAEDAIAGLNETDLHDYKVIVSWGRAVKISSTPFQLSVTVPTSQSSSGRPSQTPNFNHTPPQPPSFQNGPTMLPAATLLPRPPLPPPHPVTGLPPHFGMSLPPIPILKGLTQETSGQEKESKPTFTSNEAIYSNPNARSQWMPVSNTEPTLAVPKSPHFILPPPLPPHAIQSSEGQKSFDIQHSEGGVDPTNWHHIQAAVASAAKTVLSTSIKSHPLPPPPPPTMLQPLPLKPQDEEDPSIIIEIPTDPRIRSIVDATAKYVAQDGAALEKTILQRETSNPEYHFLTEYSSPLGQYYRWKTYICLMEGDNASHWNDEPCQLGKGSPFIIPPIVNPPPSTIDHPAMVAEVDPPSRSRTERGVDAALLSGAIHRGGYPRRSVSPSNREATRRRSRSRSNPHHHHHRMDRDRDRDRGRNRDNRRSRSRSRDREGDRADRERYAGLTGAQIERLKAKERPSQTARLDRDGYNEWMDLLAGLTLSRESIKVAMGFAYDNVDFADEIVQLIHEKLVRPDSHSSVVRIAALFLLSDLLHNSNSPIKNATNYKMLIQTILPEIFEIMAQIFRQSQQRGRMSAYQVEERVKKLFTAWSEWSLFPVMYVMGLQATFYQNETEHRAQSELVQEYLKQSETAGDSGSGREDEDVEKLEAVRRKAKSYGVAFTNSSSAFEIMCKIEYIDKYVQKLTKTWSAGPVLDTMVGGSKTVEDEVDGEELDLDGELYDIDNNNGDDLDGVPMESMDPLMDQEGLEEEEGLQTEDNVDMDEDIDGVPLSDDIDGFDIANEENTVDQ